MVGLLTAVEQESVGVLGRELVACVRDGILQPALLARLGGQRAVECVHEERGRRCEQDVAGEDGQDLQFYEF